jgi:type II secretory pathway pseudopilin PulG
MELMIVVVITGILSAVAIPSFTSYMMRARTTEAVQFLGVIKMRQESHRAEFGAYLSAGVADPKAIAFLPGGKGMMKNSVALDFPPPSDATPWFGQLGASPDGPVRFGYGWAAGGPAAALDPSMAAYGIGPSTADNYFVAQAISDLDGDGTACIFEMTSFTRSVWIGDEAGHPLPAGYE